jgi:hypothetical protein
MNASLLPQPYAPVQTVEGPAFSYGAKVAITVFMTLLSVYAVLGIRQVAGQGIQLTTTTQVLLIATLALVALMYYWVMRSRVRIDATGITQTWLSDKHVAWADIKKARMVAIPRLEFMIPPRLIVSAGFARGRIFNGGSIDLWREFARIDQHYRK